MGSERSFAHLWIRGTVIVPQIDWRSRGFRIERWQVGCLDFVIRIMDKHDGSWSFPSGEIGRIAPTALIMLP